jgi:hypothetical protein
MTRNRLHKPQGHSGYGSDKRRLEDEGTTYSDGVLEVRLVSSENRNGTYWRELLVFLRLRVIGTRTECSARVVGPVLLQIREGEDERLVVEWEESWRRISRVTRMG